MRIKRIAIAALAAVAIGAATVWTIGTQLSTQHTASMTVQLDAPVADVWRIVRGIELSADWREGVSEIRRLPDQPVETYLESGDFGEIKYVVESERAPFLLVTRIVDNSAFGGTWTHELSERDGGNRTQLTVTEEGEIYSPMFRFFARFVFGYNATLEAYMRDLNSAI